MAGVHHNGSGRPPVDPAENPSPRAVPELPTDEGFRDPTVAPPGPPQAETVTDEDRSRFGVLLDHAAERGLLGPTDYEVRLRDLAEATSIEQMTAIVSELPAFTSIAGTTAEQTRTASDALAFGTMASPVARRRAPWALLVIVVAAVALALMVLALYTAHTVHTRTGGGQSAPVTLSVPRL